MSEYINKKLFLRKLADDYNRGLIPWGTNEIIKDIINECECECECEKVENKRLKDIRGWLIENIFRDVYVMYSDARDVHDIDLINVIASLYNEYHNAVMGERYDYMVHWANKCCSWCDENLFDEVLKDESGN